MRAVASLPDPVGVVDDGWRLPNGVDIIARCRVPLGVVAVILRGTAQRHRRRGRALPQERATP